ncbi:hypothetical protein OPV22_003170 [Ensete ventricosum]|uniref:Uncharacterized protein n=1 Tax=Ensete ventricosum TaxID=4639 RepID=A0AAV8S047_ENSVE|nr:hypothetical protein OPV22_003170 [Ensete ventricosum]
MGLSLQALSRSSFFLGTPKPKRLFSSPIGTEVTVRVAGKPGLAERTINSCSQSRWRQENSYFDGRSDSKDDDSDNPEYVKKTAFGLLDSSEDEARLTGVL